jgi:acetyltransferase EpsM
MMKKVILIGAGGHAAELRDYIRFNNNTPSREKIEVEGFIDDDPSTYEHYAYEEAFLGAIKGHAVRQDVCYLMAIANLKYRRLIIEKFMEEGAELIGFIHPTALISPSAEIHSSVVISHNASVGPKAKIGKFNMLNSRCTIGHDTQIGDYNFISPQVALSGNTKLGNENLLGTNSATIPGVKIGNNNIIGAGAIVIKDVPDGVTVVGNKARILERK